MKRILTDKESNSLEKRIAEVEKKQARKLCSRLSGAAILTLKSPGRFLRWPFR
jgi:hypothetical protein